MRTLRRAAQDVVTAQQVQLAVTTVAASIAAGADKNTCALSVGLPVHIVKMKLARKLEDMADRLLPSKATEQANLPTFVAFFSLLPTCCNTNLALTHMD